LNIKLIAADLDGTTLKEDKTVSDTTVAAFESAAEKGIYVVPATGRTFHMIPERIAGLKCIDYAVTSNGASVVDIKNNSIIYSNLLSTKTALQLLDILSCYNTITEVFANGNSQSESGAIERLPGYDKSQLFYYYRVEKQVFVDSLRDFVSNNGTGVEKICIPYLPEKDVREEIIRKVSTVSGCSITSANKMDVEINAETANKGSGLKHLCDYLKIGKDHVMVFGDEKNDIDMFRFAKVAVAMGNAAPELKRAADIITETNENDGVALAVKKYALCAQ
jgi:hypothetical protein